MRARSITLLLVAFAALALGACGNKESRTTHADTEGIYVDVGPLKYQVQISRLLNPNNLEDKGYLIDLPAGQALGAQDQWFAVFMRVENGSHHAAPIADQYKIVDTEGNEYTPIQMGPKNVFSYRAGELSGNSVFPAPDSPAAENTIQGAMLLFKIPVANFENRPLVLEIKSSAVPDESATVNLDV
ncbi:MAG TPA: hypothetical protein VKB54_17790 [Solirubrobacteraceae bacterium]|nr:hypothetical protein [Solirubrobacteraceae bacterium]